MLIEALEHAGVPGKPATSQCESIDTGVMFVFMGATSAFESASAAGNRVRPFPNMPTMAPPLPATDSLALDDAKVDMREAEAREAEQSRFRPWADTMNALRNKSL